jgi:phage-related protein
MKTPEDEEFERIEAESGWRKKQIQKAIEDDDIQDYKKPWAGLKPSEIEYLSEKWRIIYGAYVTEFVEEIEAILRSRNT